MRSYGTVLLTRTQRKEDRFKAIKEYRERFKKDPSAFLDESDWMSSEVSELDTDDEGKKLAHRERIATETGVDVERLEDEVIWEVIRPAWRAQSVCSLTRFDIEYIIGI